MAGARQLHSSLLVLAALLAACGPAEPDLGATANEPRPLPPAPSGDAGPVDDAPPGFIGSPCERDDDCTYDGAVCLLGAFPGGTCSLPCDRYCPDQDGYPVTFCVDAEGLPADAASVGDGACLSRCDLVAFPGRGCREGYACTERARANEPETTQLVCLPGEESELSDCLLELSYLGVDFSVAPMVDESPSTHPELTCHVEDPVLVHPPVHGVDLIYYDGAPTPSIRASCEMAKALVQTVDDVAPLGVTAIRHIGTYNCRVIAGTDTLSRHAFGDALDVYGFDFDDGTTWTLVDDWEHDTEDPVTEAGQFLYDAAHRWYDQYLWAIILTPNYNAAHDNHFHVDLTPGSHYVGYFDGRYLGPAPFND